MCVRGLHEWGQLAIACVWNKLKEEEAQQCSGHTALEKWTYGSSSLLPAVFLNSTEMVAPSKSGSSVMTNMKILQNPDVSDTCIIL